MWTWLSQSLSTKVPIQIFDILDYLQVESMTKRLNENEFIENNKNTVDDDLGNVESATEDSNNGNFIRTKKFYGL